MPDPFPKGRVDDNEDLNPAIQLFGRRFFSDQTTLEFLVELLLVAVSRKQINYKEFDSFLPPYELLKNWPRRAKLEYAPKARLNLKLFSFYGSSKLDTRHEAHRNHLRELDQIIKENMAVSGDNKENILKTLENLFLGFQGSGSQRTWCAQSFVPVCPGFLGAETLWNETDARRSSVDSWDEIIDRFTVFFSVNRHRFLARGGEVLYLQLCNALRQPPEVVEEWARKAGLEDSFTHEELNPIWLHEQLDSALRDLMRACPKTVSDLADFIDSGVEDRTAGRTDKQGSEARYTECGWCPEESWQEGYLFAVEVLRLCRTKIDLMERLELLEVACSMQVLRSLATQAARYAPASKEYPVPFYRLVISDPDGQNITVRQISRASVRVIEKMIYDAIRHTQIESTIPKPDRQKLYREADRRYGYKLFIALAKRIGLIIPRRGSGMRFVLNERLVRFLVMTLVPAKRLTYDTFKALAEAHYGLIFDELALSRTSEWATGARIESFGGSTDEWLQETLEAAGILRRLSDSCALVENPVVSDIKGD
jgi:hypothetical protein